MRALLLLVLLGACTPSPPAPVEPLAPPRLTFATPVFPTADEWPSVTPEEAGWDVERLEAALELLGNSNTSGFLLCYQGRILVERTWPVDPYELPRRARTGFVQTSLGEVDGRLLEDVTSVQKSIAALLIARARDEGFLDYSDTISDHVGPGWSQAAPETEATITLRHVLDMTTGLRGEFEERWPPGTHWRYDPRISSWLVPVLEAATSRRRDELLSEWLAEPIGLRHTSWVEYEGTVSLGLSTTLRDLARIGLLVMNGGRWSDRQVIRAESLEELLTQGTPFNPGYGLSWWLNNEGILLHDPDLQGQRALPHAPPDLVMAMGLMDKDMCVSRAEQIVTVRFGAKYPGPGAERHDEIWAALMAARPSSE